MTLERIHKGREVGFDLHDMYGLEELKEDLQECMVDYMLEDHQETAAPELAACSSYAELAEWYRGYEPVLWHTRNHDMEDFRYAHLADKMRKQGFVTYHSDESHDYWKYGGGHWISGDPVYAEFYRECDLLCAKKNYGLDDDDIDILRI